MPAREREIVVVGALVADAFAADVARLPVADRFGDADEEIAQARGAADRLRSHLQNFASILDASWRDATTGELGRLATVVAPAHDAEILAQVLTACAAALPTDEALRLDPLFRAAEAELSAARERALALLRSDEYASLRDRVASAAADPPVAADASSREWADDVLTITWDRLMREIESLDSAPDRAADAAHSAAMRAQLAAESAAALFGEPATRFANSLRAVRRTLGAQRGAAIAMAWVRKQGVGDSPEAGFAAGMASGLLRNSINSARAELPALWAKAQRRRERLWS